MNWSTNEKLARYPWSSESAPRSSFEFCSPRRFSTMACCRSPAGARCAGRWCRRGPGRELRVRRLVDDHRAHELGRILVELDAAVVAGADLLASVEQRGRESGVGAAQADRRGAAFRALRRQARQARDRFGDAGVGQLADVFGRNRLDDAHRLLLGRRSRSRCRRGCR